MDQQSQRIRLKLPEQDLRTLTLGSDRPAKLRNWVEQLPMMNMGETSRQLYQYIQELNRLEVAPRTRFELLEVIRPVVQQVCTGLSKHYLNQALVLPEKARRVASLAQSLQGHMASGYKLVVARGLGKLGDKDMKDVVVTALHRAITALNETLLRCYQLYFPTPRHLWMELHQLYLLAELNRLEHVEVEDPEFGLLESSTVTDAYGRALLLATCKPNQLRQQELSLVYQATEEWSGFIDVKMAADNDDLFVFDLSADRPPTYRTHASAGAETSRYIESGELVKRLVSSIAGEKPSDFHLPRGMSDTLVNHLQRAWGALTERSFRRVDQEIALEICLGLGAVHYFVSDGEDFARLMGDSRHALLADEEDNPFLRKRAPQQRSLPADADPWAGAYDGGAYRMAQEGSVENIDLSRITSALQERRGESKTKFHKHECRTVNVSPGGYCLAWEGETPAQLRTGELMGIIEESNPEWALGVIRWVKQLSSQGARFGVELLAPRAMPAGGRVIKKTGEPAEFQRVLLLPELHAIGQPATLVVPSVGFQTGSRVELVHGGKAQRIQLQRKLNSTASFGQFEFRLLDGQPGASRQGAEEGDGDDFNSIWSSL